MKYKYVHIVEEDDGWFLSIGRKAPWLNDIYFKVPKFLAMFILKCSKR